MSESSPMQSSASQVTNVFTGLPDDFFPVNRIDHVAILVRDGDRAINYFRDSLNLRLMHDETLSHTNSRLIYLDAGNSFVQLVQPVGPGSLADHLAERGEGLHHVCFETEDIQSVLDVLPGESDSAIFQGGRGRRSCFLAHNPNGAKLEFTERESLASAVDTSK